MSDPDAEIDALYQGGLAGFVAARNALAKALKRPDLKTLEKPTAPAWAVNQLYWRDRAIFDRLVEASEALRAAHRDALGGQPADLRGAESMHRAAVRDALAAAQRALVDAGQAVSPATVEAIRRTLEALPHPEAQGRLVQPLSPAGLEALVGLTVTPAPPRSTAAAAPAIRPGPGAAAPVAPPAAATPPAAPPRSARGPATITQFPQRPDPEAVRAAAREREAAAREAREGEAKARDARQRAADEALRAAATDYERAQAEVAAAETRLSETRKARDAAAAAYDKAKRAVRDLV